MSAEKATALVLRTTDWSESSRIATLWTREFGKVRVLAKGGRRLKSNFDNALDLLTLCGIVFLRKSSGSLDLLTEAQVIQRFPRLRTDLAALYAAYYVAELLSDWTQDYDPHPLLFDEALDTLRALGGADSPGAPAKGGRVA
ncbi:MAG TPA: DNA repair protein RecO, partial [Gemmataceae bacterium]|nr:DNA repair protein RecO [Gemmataceae bacterium]